MNGIKLTKRWTFKLAYYSVERVKELTTFNLSGLFRGVFFL